MCWLTVDCALYVAAEVFGRDRTEWESLRATIAEDVLSNGWNEKVGAFTAAYGADDIDASVLALGLVGLIDPADDRYRSTVDTIETWLRDGPTVRRYNHDDGLPGVEGGFNLMTSWLIDAKILLGDVAGARELFDDYIELVGNTGLLAEEYDPATGRALGNHPQAYSHLGLINNACNLDAASAT
jgi:GH15 family glucan-1,4-alpha-glucosidase